METNIKVVGKIDLNQFSKKSENVIIKTINLPVKKRLLLDKKPKIEYPKEEIHFFLDKNKKIVGRLSNGKITIISFEYKTTWIKDGQTWLCDIISEEEKKAIVIPISLTKTSTENFEESIKRLELLKTEGFKHKPLINKSARLVYSC
jgi:hypothetical protein